MGRQNISADGYFVTNNHVVVDSTKVTVQFSNGDEKPAKIVGTDAKTDLAVIKVDGLTNQPFVKLSDTKPRVGDWVMAVGNPFGLGGTVTAGIVSALDRDIGGKSDDSYMQIDASVNSGNSGGPDFDLKGGSSASTPRSSRRTAGASGSPSPFLPRPSSRLVLTSSRVAR